MFGSTLLFPRIASGMGHTVLRDRMVSKSVESSFRCAKLDLQTRSFFGKNNFRPRVDEPKLEAVAFLIGIVAGR